MEVFFNIATDVVFIMVSNVIIIMGVSATTIQC